MTMVALGGSITAGQGVTVAQDNYVNRLYRWVQVRPHMKRSSQCPPFIVLLTTFGCACLKQACPAHTWVHCLPL